MPVDDALRQRIGDKEVVIVGVRPEYVKDATLAGAPSEGVRFSAVVDQTEWLGNEQYAYIPFEADQAVRDKLEELDRDLDGEGMRTQLVVDPWLMHAWRGDHR